MTNFEAAKKFIKMKRAHATESLSGPGSFLANTTEIVSFINFILPKYEIRTILDLGCGDWNWFKKVNLTNVRYEGWDCDNDMILKNKSYGHNFYVKDIVTEDYPLVDLIICRDVLFHLPKSMGNTVIKKIKDSSKFFLSTTFNNVSENTDINNYANIKNWGYYPINLNIEPFNLGWYEVETTFESAMNRNVSLYKW